MSTPSRHPAHADPDAAGPASHRVWLEGQLPDAGQILTIGGDEARHALSVKRLRVGERVDVLDGRGGVAMTTVLPPDSPNAKPRDQVLKLSVSRVISQPPVMPRVEVWSATPKGDRAPEMIDQLSQVGAASWTPLVSQRSVVDPREHKLERLRRVAVEAMKQCGRAWLMMVGEPTRLDAVVTAGVRVVVADASGAAYAATDAKAIRLLVGPEGGWTLEELAALRAAGATVARFGPHVMRIETAAVAACAVVVGGRNG